jgi:uncharacterized membrane protein
MHPMHPIAVRAASIFLLLLIGLCVAWETWLAPLRPGGSWLVLKAIPLLFPLRGILHGRRYTYQWTSLLCLPYFGEGLARAASDAGASSMYAAAEVLLAVGLFTSIVAALRIRAPTPR